LKKKKQSEHQKKQNKTNSKREGGEERILAKKGVCKKGRFTICAEGRREQLSRPGKALKITAGDDWACAQRADQDP